MPREETLSAFIAAFRTVGYEVWDDASVEAGFQKIAIYTDAQQTSGHIARQLANGEWTSKIGQYEDIQHKTLEALTGEDPAYGTVAQIMRKQQDITSLMLLRKSVPQ